MLLTGRASWFRGRIIVIQNQYICKVCFRNNISSEVSTLYCIYRHGTPSRHLMHTHYYYCQVLLQSPSLSLSLSLSLSIYIYIYKVPRNRPWRSGGGRGIALSFLDLGTRRGGWSAPRPGRFTPGKDPVPILQEAKWAPGPVWTCAKNLAPTWIWSPEYIYERVPDSPIVHSLSRVLLHVYLRCKSTSINCLLLLLVNLWYLVFGL
jgi:hypothetical protein